MNDEYENRPGVQADAPTKTTPQLLGISIHVAHLAWMVALTFSVANSGAIQSYALFMPLLVVASFLEIWRWSLQGRQIVEINGAYSHASAIEKANRNFLLFSWYVIPPLPPFKLLERYAAAVASEVSATKRQGQIFARFWLKSNTTLPLLVVELVLISVLYPGSSPEIYGFGKFHPVACLFWIAGFGALSKSLSVFSYSVFVRIHKGF